MKSVRVFITVLCGFLVCVVQCQVQPQGGSVQVAVEDDEDAALVRMTNVTTVDDFIALLQIDGRPLTRDDIFSEYDSETGKQVIQGGGRMAQPDDCSPRETTIRLNMSDTNPMVVYFPKCTKIERCGGCCSSPNLECVPLYTERVSLQVLKAEASYPGSTHLTYTGMTPVIVDRHVTCRVQCGLTQEKCGPKKVFLAHMCDCKCREYGRCQPPLIWDPENCRCQCAETIKCCRDGEHCNLAFNEDTCTCGIQSGRLQISGNENITSQDINNYYQSLNNPGAEENTPPTTTTTTTTTTTVDPCATVNCPVGFTKQVINDAICVCTPNFRYRGRGGRN